MNKTELLTDQQYIFGSIFIIANRIDTLLGREFTKFDVTTKQWLLSIIIDNLFNGPPTIKEVAKEMGSSHQNVKQLALKLEKKGYMTLEKDKTDSRVTRLKLSKHNLDFWEKLRLEGTIFTKGLFKDINKEEFEVARKVMRKILSNVDELDK